MGVENTLEMLIASLALVVFVVSVIFTYIITAGNVAVFEKYTMDQLDVVSLSYLAESCLAEKSGGHGRITESFLEGAVGTSVENLCGITKPCEIKIFSTADKTSSERKLWKFTQDSLSVQGEYSHSVYVTIGNGDEFSVGEMVVTV